MLPTQALEQFSSFLISLSQLRGRERRRKGTNGRGQSEAGRESEAATHRVCVCVGGDRLKVEEVRDYKKGEGW